MLINKKILLSLYFSLFSFSAWAVDGVVYKSQYCQCCDAWITHMQDAGFDLNVVVTEEMGQVKQDNKVPSRLASCHTLVIDGYVFEGHVPAADVKSFLKEKPSDLGLTIPGMPQSAPGMDIGSEPYTVYAYREDGKVRVYNKYN